MPWGAVELESEVEKWLESLPTALFARAAFYVDLLVAATVLAGPGATVMGGPTSSNADQLL
jgi:hypothetical protein